MERIDEPGPDDEVLDVPRRGRTALTIAVALAFVAAALVVFLGTRDQGSEAQTASPLVGELAPAVAGETLDGDRFDLDRRRGRWVLVNFFATWCVPCREEHPELIELTQRHAEAGDLSLVSVVVETDEDEARAFFDDRGGDWPVVLDPSGRTALEYGMVKVPETFLVAPDGTVVTRLIGGIRADQVDSIIAELTRGAQ